jgi:reverse gyrase
VVKVLTGTKGCMLTILRYGGCGKTSTLATLVMCLALLGYRTVILSQSNKAVQAVMEKYGNVVETDNLAKVRLANTTLRLRNKPTEAALNSRLKND